VTPRGRTAVALVAGCSLFVSTGCATRLAFGTATKVGIDISQRPDQSVELSLGYDRMEVVVIPAYSTDDAGRRVVKDPGTGQETYSVLGTFQVRHGNPFSGQPLFIHQFFATGHAAIQASKTGAFRTRFGATAGEIYGQGKKDTATKPDEQAGDKR
jgi:hypothetical protein